MPVPALPFPTKVPIAALGPSPRRVHRFPTDNVHSAHSGARTRYPHLLCELYEIRSGTVSASAGLQQRPDGKQKQNNLEQSPARVILVGALDVPSEHGRAWQPEERSLCLVQGIVEKSEECVDARLG
jgi:hypothetical protein